MARERADQRSVAREYGVREEPFADVDLVIRQANFGQLVRHDDSPFGALGEGRRRPRRCNRGRLAHGGDGVAVRELDVRVGRREAPVYGGAGDADDRSLVA